MSFVPPPFSEIMPNPAPGQMLVSQNGEDPVLAPGTFSEAWEQIFAPLDEFEKAAGRIVWVFSAEKNRVIEESLGLDHLGLSTFAHRSITTERLGSIFHIRCKVKGGEESCSHETATELTAQMFATLCSKCLGEMLKTNPDFLALDYDYNRFAETEELHIEYRISDKAMTEAKEWVEKLTPLKYLIMLRQRAVERPWLIFSEPQKTVVNQHPSVVASEAIIADLMVKAEPYAGIDKHGWTNMHTIRAGSIAHELHEIHHALRIFHPPAAVRGRIREDASSKRNYYQKRYEQHEQMLASIALTEEKLGEPLPDDIKNAANEANSRSHKTYLYGVLKGHSRRDEILAGHKAVNSKLSEAIKEKSELVDSLHSRLDWGRGYPAGALSSPTIDEWSEITGYDFSNFKDQCWL